jgi:hypothetical protein
MTGATQCSSGQEMRNGKCVAKSSTKK